MNKEKEIEEITKFIESEQPISWRFKFSLNIDDVDNDPDVEIMARYTAENFVAAGYGNVKQYQDEIARLETELAHREQDLVHADESVSIREAAVKLEAKKIKKQAVIEFAEKIEKLLCEHEKRYSHLCKSKKECHDETCRYQAILRLHKEMTELYGGDE